MQRLKNWEVEMPHAEFMAEIRRMSSGTYAAARSWSEALWDRKDRSSTSDETFAGNGGRAGRPRLMKPDGARGEQA